MNPRCELVLRPIGWVVERRMAAKSRDHSEEIPAVLEIDPAWAGALDGIGGFSHIWVVWWANQLSAAAPPEALHIHPEGREELPLVGFFATRSPRRPNPLAITAVRLLECEGTRLRVEGLDAYQGTPILDIKPYLRRGDLIPEATAPGWLKRLWRIHDAERG